MRILNVTAQKPDSTGSGVYLAEMVRCEVAAGHSAAVICGIAPDDPLPFPAGVSAYPVHFETDEVPFSVCGMSDEMPYRATRYRDMDHQMVSCFRAAFAKRIERAVEEFCPDVVVCHHLYLLTALVRSMVSDIPVFAICHSTDLRQMRTHSLERDAIIEGIRSLTGVLPSTVNSAARSSICMDASLITFRCWVLGTTPQCLRLHPRIRRRKVSYRFCTLARFGKRRALGVCLMPLTKFRSPGNS